MVKNNMIRFFFCAIIFSSAAIGGFAPANWSSERFFVRIVTVGSFYDFQGECVISNSVIYIRSYKDGDKLLFSRRLSSGQLSRFIEAIKSSSIPGDLGKSIVPDAGSGQESVLMPGYRLIRFQLGPQVPKISKGLHPLEVSYWDHTNASIRNVIAELNRFIPIDYAFIKEP